MDQSEFFAGVRDIAPALPSGFPFGMLFGATAVQVGIDPVAAIALSVFTFAAVAQLAAVELLQEGTTLPVMLATILLINVRYVIFSASLAPKVRHLSTRWRAVIAFPLMDITYALAVARFAEVDPDDGHRGWYFLGVSLPIVGSFALATLTGALAGQAVGRGLHLEFAIPLIFVSLLVPQIKGRPEVLAAVGAGVVAVLGADLPFNLGLLVAALCGTIVGALVDADASGWSR